MQIPSYITSIRFLTADYLFSDEEKKLFLKIPHKVINHDKIIEYSFDVPENGQYPILSQVKLIELTDDLTREEQNSHTIRKLLHNTCSDGKKAFHIQSYHGTQVFNLMQELYKHDKSSALKMLNEYYKISLESDEIVSISEMFVTQAELMAQYLKKENITVPDYKLDYESYSDRSDEEMEIEVKKLEKKFGKGFNFEAYNDWDYTPMIIDGDYCIHDISSASLFVVKDDGISKRFYLLKLDYSDHNLGGLSEWLHDFMHEHQQINVMRKNLISEAELIGEVKNGKLIKATVELDTMNLLQSFIVKELAEKGKITLNLPTMSFQELLENFTKQKEHYHIEERSLIPLLKSIQVIDGKLTYEDFSLMKNNIKIKHEEIHEWTVRDVTGLNSDGTPIKGVMGATSLKHLSGLPDEYKVQINDYLSSLLERDKSENAKKLVEAILQSLELPQNNRKLKM